MAPTFRSGFIFTTKPRSLAALYAETIPGMKVTVKIFENRMVLTANGNTINLGIWLASLLCILASADSLRGLIQALKL
jgi:hypothetical protein